MKQIKEDDNPNMGFQIAPMIDVVFVIMLFFMVMAGAVKVEHELKTALPGSTPKEASDIDISGLDEVTIVITEDGMVTMNDEEFDSPTDKKLPRLTGDLIKLQKDAENRGGKVLVTLQTEEQAKYERVIDVLNALGKAKLQNVTFTVGNDES
ncbi:MAG: biopolymer transporter ExbD [Verrucomicrobia bacterium]|nr:biopolymer transporter ExbD [Verrucomicrobiota bacterium]